MVKEFKAPHMLDKSNFVAQINEEGCALCGLCKDERCPMEAIVEEDGSYKVLSDRCIGCGVCTVTCPTESITMRARLERMERPADLLEWNAKRAASRGIEIKY